MASPKAEATEPHATPESRLQYVKEGDHAFERGRRLMQVLRGPNGCPWDIEQTSQSLRKFVLEEAYEVVDAIDGGNVDELRDELGDFVLQAIFLSQLAEEKGQFALPDVFDAVVNKMIDRHPHVFGSDNATTADDVLQAWEQRRAQRNKEQFGGNVARSMPALSRAQQLGGRAAKLGFDYLTQQELDDHFAAEWSEVQQARQYALQFPDDPAAKYVLIEEMGDMLFMMTNYCRFWGIEAEEALSLATAKFQRRMTYVLQTMGTNPPTRETNPEVWDAAWNAAKLALGAKD